MNSPRGSRGTEQPQIIMCLDPLCFQLASYEDFIKEKENKVFCTCRYGIGFEYLERFPVAPRSGVAVSLR